MLRSTSMLLIMLSLNNQLSLSIYIYVTISCFVGLERERLQTFSSRFHWIGVLGSQATRDVPRRMVWTLAGSRGAIVEKNMLTCYLNCLGSWCFWDLSGVFIFVEYLVLFLRCCFQPLYKRRTAQLTSPWLALVMPTPGGLWFRNPASTPVPVSQFVGLRNPSKKGVKETNNPISISIFPYVSIIASFLSTSYPQKKCAPLSGTSFEGKDGVFRVEGQFLLGDVMRHGRGWRHEIKLINHRPSVVYFWHHLHISSTEMFMGLE